MTSGWLSILLSVGLVLLFMHYLIECARRYHDQTMRFISPAKPTQR